MKFASFKHEGRNQAGVVTGETVLPLARLAAAAGVTLPDTLLDLIRGGESAMNAVRDAVAAVERASRVTEVGLPAASVELLPPLPSPPKVICVARNYAEHAREAGLELPKMPILFPRFANTFVGHGGPVVVPSVSHQLDWEGELAVIIGRDTKGRIGKAEAMDYVFGYSIFNDVTVRDYQFRVTQYTGGKNFRSSGPFGPYIVSADEVGDPHALDITTRLNGKVEQHANTGTMIFDIPTILEHIADFIDLEAGDVIATGTPAGVGFKRQPPVFLKNGDVIEVSIDKIGTLSNPVVDER